MHLPPLTAVTMAFIASSSRSATTIPALLRICGGRAAGLDVVILAPHRVEPGSPCRSATERFLVTNDTPVDPPLSRCRTRGLLPAEQAAPCLRCRLAFRA